MSINAIINNSLTGLFTNQAALRTTSSNIANINTPGYARQIIQQEAVVNGTSIGGVKISEIVRVVDKFLVKAVHEADAEFARYEIENTFHSRIQALLGRPDQNNSLSGRIDKVFNSMSELALNPLSTILKESTLATIEQFGEEIGSLAKQVQSLRLDASNQIADNVALINTLTDRIVKLNPLITKETLTGGEPGGLIEKRAQSITELAKILDLNVIETGNNAVQITTSSGIALVGVTRSVLRYSPPGAVTSSTPFSPISVHLVDPATGVERPSNIFLDGQVKSGELKGLLTLRDKDLPEIALELGSLAGGFIDELNRVHNMNTAVPAPNSLTGINGGMLSTDNHNFTGEAIFAVTDASGTLVSKVNIDFTVVGPTIGDVITAVNAGLGGTGTLAINNGVMSITAAGGANGVSISQVAGNESSRAGRGFSHFFSMNNLVESKWPSHFESGIVGTDNHGFTAGGVLDLKLNDKDGILVSAYSLTIGGASYNDILTDLNASPLNTFVTFSYSSTGELISTPNAGVDDMSIHVKSDSTSRGGTDTAISTFFGIGDSFRTDTVIDLKVSQNVRNDIQLFALARLDQTAIVGGNALSVGDQAGALALRDLENASHKFSKAGGLGAATITLAQYSANLLGNLGLRASIAEVNMEDNLSLSEELNRKSSDISGVNLDEELGQMVIYQNAYSASARLLNTAKEMFDTILRIV